MTIGFPKICLLILITLALSGLGNVASALDVPGGLSLFVPVVAFQSPAATISRDRLLALRSGQADDKLVLSHATADTLKTFGVNLSTQIKTIDAAELLKTLISNPRLYTLLAFDALTPHYRILHIDETRPVDDDLTRYPFAFPSAAPNYHPERLTRFLMSGTTAMTRFTSGAIGLNGYQWAGSGIRPYTTRVDYFHISNEVSFDPTCADEAKSIGPFCTKDSAFDLLPYLGVKIVELTGNHNLDLSATAYLRTLQLYRLNGMTTIGGGENLAAARQTRSFNHHGNRIGMLSCNWAGPSYALAGDHAPGAAYCDLDWLRAALPALKAANDFVIVSVQYHEFDSIQPVHQQRVDFRTLADLGADVVIGTQAHIPQTFEFYPMQQREAYIHYGLGNLFFDQTGIKTKFFMDQLFIYEGRLLTVDLFPGVIDELGRPRAMNDGERTDFLSLIFQNSGADLQDNQH